MKIFKKGHWAYISYKNNWHKLGISNWTNFLNRPSLRSFILSSCDEANIVTDENPDNISSWDPPMGQQEIWASGVTYLRSKIERMNEAKDAGGADFYDRVYDADRPELFFKASPARTVGTGDSVFIRRDSAWNVPEPECTLFISSSGTIEAYTIGNDMSSRSIEGENPLYLPQAKTYERCASIGPCLYLPESPLPLSTRISMSIVRNEREVFAGNTTLEMMKRSFQELVSYLYKECEFPNGSFLMTGTGIVPAEDFTLEADDLIEISMEGIGTLVNTVGHRNPG